MLYERHSVTQEIAQRRTRLRRAARGRVTIRQRDDQFLVIKLGSTLT